MKLFSNNLSSISRLVIASIIAMLLHVPIVNALEPVEEVDINDNENVVITVKESPAFVTKSGKVFKRSKNLEKVCLSMKLAMLLRTDLDTGYPMDALSLPQVTYFPMLDGVRVNHTDVLAKKKLTCDVEGEKYTLGEILGMLHEIFAVDVQVCWDCWISRYGYPEFGTSSNPVYGGIEDQDLMSFLGLEKKAIQDMFNNADKIIDFD